MVAVTDMNDVADGEERPAWYRTSIGQACLTLVVFAALLSLWWGYIVVMDLSPLILPTPYAVLDSLVENSASGLLLGHLWTTLVEILLGFALAASSASRLGL